MTTLLWLGVAGTALFVLTFLIDGATRPGYRPVRHPISALALGDRWWVQTANFVVSGALITLAAPAVAEAAGSWWLAIAIAVFGLSLVASGVFPMDPMRAYPPGTPDRTPEQFSTWHQWHDWAGVAVFTSLPVAALIAAFVLPGGLWTWYSAVTAAVFTGLFIAFGMAWESDSPRAGLIQRATVAVGWLWLALLCAHLATEVVAVAAVLDAGHTAMLSPNPGGDLLRPDR